MDVVPFLITLVACLLLGLEYGIVIGIASNLVFILYRTARPVTNCESIKVANHEVLLVTPDQSLFFSAAEYIKYKVMKSSVEHSTTTLIVINGHFVQHMDSTAASNLKTLAEDLAMLNKDIVFWNFPRQPVGVAYRLSSDFGALFKEAHSLEEIVVITTRTKQLSIVSQN